MDHGWQCATGRQGVVIEFWVYGRSAPVGTIATFLAFFLECFLPTFFASLNYRCIFTTSKGFTLGKVPFATYRTSIAEELMKYIRDAFTDISDPLDDGATIPEMVEYEKRNCPNNDY